MDLASAHSLKSAVKEHGTGLTAFAGAFVLQITNPMLLVFLFSIMPPFVHPENDYVSRMALLIAVFSLICLAVHLVYGFVAAFALAVPEGQEVQLVDQSRERRGVLVSCGGRDRDGF